MSTDHSLVAATSQVSARAERCSERPAPAKRGRCHAADGPEQTSPVGGRRDAARGLLKPGETRPARALRILVYGLNFAPEPTGVGHYTGDMCAWLAGNGHEIAVVTSCPYYPHWRRDPAYHRWLWTRERCHGAAVTRCPLWVPRAPTAAKRIAHLLSFALTSAPAVLLAARRFRPDVVFVVEPTSFCAPVALLAGRLAGATTWLHVQDIELGAADRLGLLDGHTWPARLFARIYSRLLGAFDQVTTLSERMRATLAQFGRTEEEIALFPNWVDTSHIRPTDASDMRAELGIGPDQSVLLYAGNLGEKQSVDVLLDTARHVNRLGHAKLVIVGQGARRDALAAILADNRQVILRPPVAEERLPALLSAADIHLLPQRPGVTRFVFPSKLAPMMSSGRPIVAQADSDCALPSILAGCGLVTNPHDRAAFLAAIDRLVGDKALRLTLGSNARRKAELMYDRSAVLGAVWGTSHGSASGPDR
jgi:colanic acid biosynthesis glycosyl transferase WcaI